ncbi:peptidoglycan-binding domain-containing protein [Rhodanobacter sp. L36]|uniref:peptidoglycan-binding domain-containing protein n=1 Tax=Rhodanobacter sp. L36 TaxID=1747221 RepID=UPI00131C40D0|nr:peptidoglycan-binding domain-containing protein [Rhodanobacter sp. L36]
MAQQPWHLGQTSEHYETGGHGPGSISHTPGDPGGPSYGLSQFALNTGSLREYLDHSRYEAAFKGLELGSPAFDAKWHEVAKADPTGFSQDQHDFTKTQFYDVQNARLKSDGLDLSQRGPAVQDALWSTSVQFRGLTPGIFEKGLGEKFGPNFDLSKLSDKEVVGAVQDYKIAHNDQLFHHSSAAVKASVLERAKEEKADLLNLADGKTAGHGQPQPARVAEAASGTLKQGAHGTAVHDLQADLAKLGYTASNGKPLKADSDFGLDTRHAVERFQHDHHLKVDGVAGQKTLEALEHTKAKNVAPNLADPKNPDHALYEQALAGVHKLDANLGRKPDQQSDQLAAGLVVAAKREGMTKIDSVVLSEDGSRAFAVEGKADSSSRQIAHVQTAEAVNTPIDQSSQALAQMAPKAMDPAPTPVSITSPIAVAAPPPQQPGPVM